MKKLELIVDNNTYSSYLKYEENVQYLKLIIPTTLKGYPLTSACSNLKSIIDSYLEKNDIRILDLSAAEGLTSFSSHTINVYELYLPDSVKNVYIRSARELRYLKAHGVESLSIENAPNLSVIDFGEKLREINLQETAIERITVPNGCQIMPYGAFRNCRKLRFADLSGASNIPDDCFYGCVELQKVILPYSLRKLGSRVFKGCKKLYSISGGLEIEEISKDAFEECFSLEMIDKWQVFNNILSECNFNNDIAGQIIQDRYFHSEQINQIGYVLNAFAFPQKIIWSLTHKKFYLIDRYVKYTNSNLDVRLEDFVVFSTSIKLSVNIDEVVNLKMHKDSIKVLRIDKFESPISNCKIDEYDQEQILEYYKSGISYEEFCNNIGEQLSTLNIQEIIDSYTITKRKWWISRPGKDDYDCTSVKKGSFYSDEYLNILLPQEDSETRDNTYSSQPYNLDEINNIIINNNIIGQFYENEKLDKTFRSFLSMRENLNVPNTKEAINIIKNKMSKYSDDDKQKMLENAISNGWKNVYPLKKDNKFDNYSKQREFTQEEERNMKNLMNKFRED